MLTSLDEYSVRVKARFRSSIERIGFNWSFEAFVHLPGRVYHERRAESYEKFCTFVRSGRASMGAPVQ